MKAKLCRLSYEENDSSTHGYIGSDAYFSSLNILLGNPVQKLHSNMNYCFNFQLNN